MVRLLRRRAWKSEAHGANKAIVDWVSVTNLAIHVSLVQD
jgi:hypothetical protein